MNGEKGNKQKERTENAQEEQGDTRNATTPKEPKDKPVKRDKPKKVDYEDQISVITELSKHITAIKQELQTATQALVESRTKEKEYMETIEMMTAENHETKQQLKEALQSRAEMQGRINAMESALTTERSDSAIQIEKPSVTFVADSNRKTITRPLRESLSNYNINEINDIYTTTDLLNRLKQKKIPIADMTIIMMGTNDIRNGLSATANKNMGEMAELLKTN